MVVKGILSVITLEANRFEDEIDYPHLKGVKNNEKDRSDHQTVQT